MIALSNTARITLAIIRLLESPPMVDGRFPLHRMLGGTVVACGLINQVTWIA